MAIGHRNRCRRLPALAHIWLIVAGTLRRLAIACIALFVGASSSFGESVILGFLKQYDSRLVGGWSSGTGMAGLAGSMLYVAFGVANLDLRYVFSLLATCRWVGGTGFSRQLALLLACHTLV